MITYFSARQSLNKAFLKVKPTRYEIDIYKENLSTLLTQTDTKINESEEYHKNNLRDFLKKTYYSNNHYINTQDQHDLVIHNGKEINSSVGVILETKSPKNEAEMLKIDHLNTKAFQQLLFYYLQERILRKNLEIKYLIITNIYEWFIFEASLFDRLFAQNKSLMEHFTDFVDKRLSIKTRDLFYQEIAKPAIEIVKDEVIFTYFNFKDYQEILSNFDPKKEQSEQQKEDDKKLISLYKILSPQHLLKLPFANDSNTLDQGFYNELLHIIGLTEIEKNNQKLIERKKEEERNLASLLENTIIQLDSLGKINRLENVAEFGDNYQEQLFNVALELVIIWINRILFLKLLEAQLINYHQQDKSFGFLNIEKIKGFDDLNSLFFQVLVRQINDRNDNVREIFAHVPYLNSSLFELSEIEDKTIVISNLTKDSKLPIFDYTVLKDNQGKKRIGKLNTLQYLFQFLDAYDFSSEGSEDIQEENKTLINASVLGLIFEKINGYKDGSFFTPGFITMYMCKETINRVVLQKFNEEKGWNCQNINDLYNKIDDLSEANKIINNIKICDPAVGSGHFLVSALNEIIALKSQLQILIDKEGKRLKNYNIIVENDDLIVTDEDGELFQYNPNNKESQRIQETLFHEKLTLIENCLFGVDINMNSVNICRLRLWIELLKNAYYKSSESSLKSDLSPQPPFKRGALRELETFPNLDINIKCGNSLVNRFEFNINLPFNSQKTRSTIDKYKKAVQTYRHLNNREQKREIESLISEIKASFSNAINSVDPRLNELRKAEGELNNLLNQRSLFEENKTEKKAREKKQKELEKNINLLSAEIEDIKNNRIYNKAFEWRFEFPEVLNNDGDFMGFDIVMGNPPYIRQEEIKELKSAFQNKYECYTGMADLYVYFYEQGFKLLKPKGYLSYISSNKYFRAGYGEKLRQYLSQKSKVDILIDFGDAHVFQVTAYPSIILISKDNGDNNQTRVLNWNSDEPVKKFVSVYQEDSFLLEQNRLTSDSWQLESPQVLRLLDKLRNIGTPLGEYTDKRFYYGIKTGFNEAFIVDKETRDKLISEHESSAEVLKPLIRGKDVKRWAVDYQDLWLLFIPWHFPLQNDTSISGASQKAEKALAKGYPAIYNHLLRYKEKLSQRNKAETGIRYEWYALQRCAASYLQEFEHNKIVWGNLATKPQFALAKSGIYLSAPANLIVSDNNLYLLAILNSQISQYLVSKSAATRRGGFLEYKPMYISEIPIPKVTVKEKKAIEKLVTKIMKQKKADSNANISKLEREIDLLVYQLYDLTEEEIKIIEKDLN